MLHVDIYFCTFYWLLKYGINKIYLDQIFILFVGLVYMLNKFISVYLFIIIIMIIVIIIIFIIIIIIIIIIILVKNTKCPVKHSLTCK